MPVVPATREAEAEDVVSWDHATALQPWWQRRLCLKKKKREMKRYTPKKRKENEKDAPWEPHTHTQNIELCLDAVIHTYNPTEAGGSLKVRSARPACLTWWSPVSTKNRKIIGQVWWLTPVIQALWRPRQVDHLRSGVQDQPDQHGETPSWKKKENIKIISWVWWHRSEERRVGKECRL